MSPQILGSHYQNFKYFSIILKVEDKETIYYYNLQYNDNKPYFIIDIFNYNPDAKYYFCIKFHEMIIYSQEINFLINKDEIDDIQKSECVDLSIQPTKPTLTGGATQNMGNVFNKRNLVISLTVLIFILFKKSLPNTITTILQLFNVFNKKNKTRNK